MDLFKTLNEVMNNGNSVVINIAKKDDKFTVSVLPGTDIAKDAALNEIRPLNIKGTAEEFDKDFAKLIKQPIEKYNGLTSDIAEFEKATEEAKAKSAMEKAKKDEAIQKVKDFTAWVTLANKNLAEKKFKDAKTCIENARKNCTTPANSKQLDDLLKKVISDSGAGSMFGAEQDLSDGKNIKISSLPKTQSKQEESEDEDDNDEAED